MLSWRLALLGLSVMCLWTTARADEEIVECDVAEELGMALDDVFAPSRTLATIHTIETKEACYRQCCESSSCNAVSFGKVRDDFQCVLLTCAPFDTCTWKADNNWASGRVNRTIQEEDNEAADATENSSLTSSSTLTSTSTSTSNSSSTSTFETSSTGNDTASSSDTSSWDSPSSSDDTPSSPSSDDEDWFAITTPSLDDDQREAIQKQEEAWDELWDKVWDEENGIEEGGNEGTTADGVFGDDDDDDDDDHDDDYPYHQTSTDKHKFDSAYLGSFSDSSIDSPALIIGATATVLFAVVVLICVALKFTNRQRGKYKRLRDEEAFNSNSVHAPLTGGGYETYD